MRRPAEAAPASGNLFQRRTTRAIASCFRSSNIRTCRYRIRRQSSAWRASERPLRVQGCTAAARFRTRGKLVVSDWSAAFKQPSGQIFIADPFRQRAVALPPRPANRQSHNRYRRGSCGRNLCLDQRDLGPLRHDRQGAATGRASVRRFVPRALARQRAGELRQHLPHARRHGPDTATRCDQMPRTGDRRRIRPRPAAVENRPCSVLSIAAWNFCRHRLASD